MFLQVYVTCQNNYNGLYNTFISFLFAMCADHVQLTRNLLMRAVENLQHTCTSRPRFVSTSEQSSSSSQSHTQSFQSEGNWLLALVSRGVVTRKNLNDPRRSM